MLIVLTTTLNFVLMDPVTHLTLGACTGEILLGKRFGKKAMLFGALAANLPDVDTIPGFFMPGDQSLWFHRGIAHSFFFAIIAGLLLAYLFSKWFPRIGYRRFMLFFCVELFLHDLLDTCTGYGTGLFEPFTHARFSFHLLYVVDPLFTIWLLIATIVLIIIKTSNLSRIRWAIGGIIVSLLYVLVAIYCKSSLDPKADMTTPAPFTTLLWYNIKRTDSGFYTGYQSVFDKKAVDYQFSPQNNKLLTHPEPYLVNFANGYYTLSQADGHTYFNIIRFGQIQGWQNKAAPFILSYPIDASDNENMVIQKGRLAGWNGKAIHNYLKRMMGN